MKLRSCTEYRTQSGKRRRVRLYESWRNMIGRTRGGKSRYASQGLWQGLPIAWPDWLAFRDWALSSGYSKTLCSLDRIDPAHGYGPDNCRWVTVSENSRYMRQAQLGRSKTLPDEFEPIS